MEAGLAPEEPAAAALVGVAEQLPAAAALHTDSHKRPHSDSRTGPSAPSRKRKQVAGPGWFVDPEHTAYLDQQAPLTEGVLWDAHNCAVMMPWEGELMNRSAAYVTAGSKRAILNVGFGLGLVDTAIAQAAPQRHVIVEAHPQQVKRAQQWAEGRDGVTIVSSMWQEADLAALGPFDGVYFDTYEETVDEFFDLLPAIMAPGGHFSFFNGYQPQCLIRHLSYTGYLQSRLSQYGLDCDFVPVPISNSDSTWDAVEFPYWLHDVILLPQCIFRGPRECAQSGVAVGTCSCCRAPLSRCSKKQSAGASQPQVQR